MDNDLILEEKINHLYNFFGQRLPESVIRDVLNHPDIAGHIELASGVLLDELSHDFEWADCTVEDWEGDEDGDIKCNYETGESYKIYQEMKEEHSESEPVQEEEYLEYLGETEAKEEKETFYTEVNWNESIEEKSRRNADEDPPIPRKEKEEDILVTSNKFPSVEPNESILDPSNKFPSAKAKHESILVPSNEFPSAEPNESMKENLSIVYFKADIVSRSTSELSSDSEDDDIERWLESTYGGKHVPVEKKERKVDCRITSRGAGLPHVREDCSEVAATIHPETVQKSCTRKPVLRSESQAQTQSFDTSDRATGTLIKKEATVLGNQEINRSELTPEIDHNEETGKPKRLLQQRLHAAEPVKDNATELQPSRTRTPKTKPPQTKPLGKADQSHDTKFVTIETDDASTKTKPKPRRKGGKTSEAALDRTNVSEHGFASKQDRTRTPGNQRDLKASVLYEPKCVLVTGLSETTTPDALSNYMELMTGEDVENVSFLMGKRRAVVYTSGTPDFEKLVGKVNTRSLDEMKLSVERIKACNSILISDLSPQVTNDTVMLYFENVRRSGGGDVKDVVLHKDTNTAIVRFEDGRAVDNVIGKEHSLEGKQMSVKKYYPQLSSGNTSSPSSETCIPSTNDSTDIGKVKKQEKCDLSPERPNVPTEVDPDVMAFIMNSNHGGELEERLREFKAEIEWNPGSNSATIWKKINSGYVKKWVNSCQTVVSNFLDQFERFPVPLTSLAAPVVRDALPHLIKDIPQGKALCKQNTSKQGIEVVCLESEKDTVLETVREFWGRIEKEEIRKTYKKETEKDISPERLLLLELIGFVEEMKSKHSELEITLDTTKRELYFEGPREQFSDSRIRYLHIMNTITIEDRFHLQPSTINGNFLSREPVSKYFRETFAREKINALFIVEDSQDNAIKIVALNFAALEKAKECLRQSMGQVSVSVQQQDAFIFKSTKCQKLFEDLQEGGLLQIRAETPKNSVLLYGVTDAVDSAKTKIEDFIELERIRGQNRQISKGKVRFLSDHFSEKLKEIEEMLRQSHVSVQIDKPKGTVMMSGTQEGLRKCNEHLNEILKTILIESEEYSSPGLVKLLLGETGLRNLKLVEMEKKVVIEMSKKANDGVINTRQVEVDRIERETRSLMEEKKKSREEARQKSLDSQTTECVYDLCNFTTAEGLRISWKYGSIENEQADILVNSAASNLSKFTACGKALVRKGGQAFVDACQPHTSVNAGDIVITNSGDLPSQFVIHAVCCHWDNGRGAAEQLLRGLVKKVLLKCSELRATSLAIPAIGTGQHGFPDNIVFKVLKEEIQAFSLSISNAHSLPILISPRSLKTLQEVRVIVYKARIPKYASPPVQYIPSAITPVISNSRVVTFGTTVRVSLHEGDITQQRTAVDAIVNVLPDNLQLKNGGGVCKSILNVGGQTIQQQLNAVGAANPGSIVCTNAGSVPNTNWILHFIPTSTNLADLQRSIEDCLKQVKSKNLSSVSVPAIGTASFNIPPRDSATLILNAAKNIAIFNYAMDVRIVVFQKNMVADFEAVIQEQANAQVVHHAQATQSPNVAAASSHYPRKRIPKPALRRTSVQTLKTGEAKEVVVLDVFASSQLDIDTSLKEVKKFVEEHSATKKIEHEKVFDVLVKHWPDVEDLARDHDVSITCSKSSSVAEIEGMVANVSDCKDKLFLLITTHVEEERKTNQVEFISKNVQWYYFQGSQSAPYDKELNTAIEMAYMESQETLDVTKNGDRCEIDLVANTETNRRNGQVETITRKQMGDSNTTEIAVPSHWSQQAPTQVVQLVTLQPSSQEYQQVFNHFTARGGVANQIIKIERVQNPGLYKAYLVKKQSMIGAENEQQLFHGTSDSNIVPINANKFDRSFAGANGVVYGNGVYFARDASYSLRYCKPGNHGYRHMYVAKVLVGKSTIGRQGMKAPPARNDPSNPGLLFDSLVDNMNNPSIFVIFNDHQCYPECLITFT